MGLGEVSAVYCRRPTPHSAGYGYLPAQQRDFGLSGVLTNLCAAST
ncbi:hypothetical protein H9Y04_35490 [Streptomyces sp. TRM66268-LWL]|uniref:Uncharacterized protein n=1 Tax=Streptomyces polyasparticus TaxID=2767826 RepID=A0ABR7SST5_9ACTN|nr:hypothetical protein [Streptomyces polyasparticus]MBC9717849.1 hypothetical protein [Streptomyces polyasparticus]